MTKIPRLCLTIFTGLVVFGFFLGLLSVRNFNENHLFEDYSKSPSAPIKKTAVVSTVVAWRGSDAKPLDPAIDPQPEAPNAFSRKSAFEQLPEELRYQLMNVFTEMSYGNFDQAAHVARDALQLAQKYPEWQVELHYYQGACYEKLGYTSMAIEQYNLALALQPMHRSSYSAMRRINPEFASANKELAPIRTRAKKTALTETE